MTNCLDCDNSYIKDLFDDGKEMVCICSCDNSYIGYPDEAEKEQCKFKLEELLMDKRLEYLIDKIDELGYCIEQNCNNVYYIGNFSPCGQDCSVAIDTENDAYLFINNIREYVSNYDVSYEAYLWLGSDGHGENGAPYDMKDVYEDMEWWRDSLEELANELEIILDEYDRLNEES